MNVTASNLANAETTRTAEGGVYLRRNVVLEAAPIPDFEGRLNEAIRGVVVRSVEADVVRPTNFIYDPGHPDAREDGYVEMPNVNVVEEMTDMLTASRGYEANATAFETLKRMALRALSIGT
jgi:flagellar basal-body rod protein FlgC